MRSLAFLIAFHLIFAGQLLAQVSNLPVKFSGQARVRSEVDGRDFNSDSDLNSYTLLRMRFGAKIQPLPDVGVFIQVQDSRAFGQEPGTLANTANLDVHQAYFQISDMWNKAIRLRVGRQEWVYGGQRIIGAVGWSNVGRAFDGILWTFGRQNKLDLFATIINESSTPVPGPATPASVAGRNDADNRFFGAYYKYRNNPKYKFDVYGLYELNTNETVPGENDVSRATLGVYNKGSLPSNFNFETELGLQFGKRRGQDVSAFMLTGSVGYTFQSAKKPSLRVGYDYLSGMAAGDTDYKVFHTLFATNHKFYGFMDYFISIPGNTSGRGLQDFMLKAKIPFAAKWNLNAHFHNFRAAKGDMKDFGNELDLILNYKYNAVTSFVFGLAFFSPGDLMELAFDNSDVGVWSFTQLLVNF